MNLDPSKYGAKSSADIAAFCTGAAIGGFADAILNFAGFAEPMLCAVFGGTAMLGAKNSLESYLRSLRNSQEHDPRRVALLEYIWREYVDALSRDDFAIEPELYDMLLHKWSEKTGLSKARVELFLERQLKRDRDL